MKLYVELLILAAVWGASFLFLRISSPEFGPVPLIFVRTTLASLVLLPFVFWTKSARDIVANWKIFLLVGAISTAIPFSLFAYTSIYVTAGKTSILNATTPFFSAVIAFAFLQERLAIYGVLGLILGFFGVYFLSSHEVGGVDGAGMLPVFAALVATFLYAVSSTFVKLKMSNMTPLIVATGSQLFSGLILFPFAIYAWPEENPSLLAWSSTVVMAVFSTAIALIIFFRLIQTAGVTKTVSVTYMIPLFGILWGYLFLGEQVTSFMLVGGSLILIGVGLTTGLFDGLRLALLWGKKKS